MSLAMAAELGAVIVRPKFSRLDSALKKIGSKVSKFSYRPRTSWQSYLRLRSPNLPDVDDNRILVTALASRADFIVTGDKELLALGQIVAADSDVTPSNSPIIRILSASDALDFLLLN